MIAVAVSEFFLRVAVYAAVWLFIILAICLILPMVVQEWWAKWNRSV
jgi:hypothetical protein